MTDPDPTASKPGSASRLELYEKCPRWYAYRYVQHLPWTKDDNAALVGKAVHKAIELALCEQAGAGQAPGKMSLEALMSGLGKAEGNAEIHKQAHEILALASPLVAGPEGTKVLGLEENWHLDINGHQWTGVFDLVAEEPDRGLVVTDWKSGRPKTRAELEHAPQTLLYLYAGQELYGKPVTVRYHYLTTGYCPEFKLDPAWGAYVKTRATAAKLAWERGHDTPRPGEPCRLCPYAGFCEGAQGLLHAEPRDIGDLERAEDKILIAERRRLALALGAMKSAKSRCDGELKSRMIARGTGSIPSSSATASLRERNTTKYDPSLLPDLAAALGTDPLELISRVCRVSTNEVNRLVKDNEQARSVANSYASQITSTYVEVREKKGKA